MNEPTLTDPVPAWTLRSDLTHQQISMGPEPMWVLRDPLSRQLHYFNRREYALLQLLDGRRSFAELSQEAARRFAPEHLSSAALLRFLAAARRSGLIVAKSCGGRLAADLGISPEPATNHRLAGWRNPLAIRLPGLDLDFLIAPVAARLRWVLHPAVWLVILAFLMSAGLLVATQLQTLASHLVVAAHHVDRSWFTALILVIAATKIIHELAHAVACRLFDVKCREIGVMFLVGIPCLYCDVSDAWMLAERWKRIVISAAGMAAELVLAAMATWLWWFAADGFMRDICVMVMIVCSISTVMINGNPLLRYDGYYMLSDGVGIANLASQSRARLQQTLRRWLWGTDFAGAWDSASEVGESQHRNRFLLGYAIASGLYRGFVYLAITWMLYRFAADYGFGPVTVLVALGAFGWLATKRLGSLCRPPAGCISLDTMRPTIIISLALTLALIIATVPLPQSIIAPAMIFPADAREVYATVPGRVSEMVSYGSALEAGEVIARLVNVQAEQERLQWQAECERLEWELRSLRHRRGHDAQASAQIPAMMESWQAAQSQLRFYEQQMKRLILRAPVQGRVYASRLPDQVDNPLPWPERVVDTWDRLPLSPQRRGSWVEPGTALCLVGDEHQREAVLWVRQQEVPRLNVGQRVECLLPDHQRGTVVGEVVQISGTPVKRVEQELLIRGWVDLEVGQENQRKPRETLYQVRVRLDPHPPELPHRLPILARVRTDSESLVLRSWRWFHDAFRFRS